jgi:hypothetical protein
VFIGVRIEKGKNCLGVIALLRRYSKIGGKTFGKI